MSPDGSKVAFYDTAENQLIIVDVPSGNEGKATERVISSSQINVCYMFSPNSRYLLHLDMVTEPL